MRGRDAAGIVERWRAMGWDDRELATMIADAIEVAYRLGLDTGGKVAREDMRRRLGL